MGVERFFVALAIGFKWISDDSSRFSGVHLLDFEELTGV